MTKYSWKTADIEDITEMLTLSKLNFEHELKDIFNINFVVSARNLNLAIVNQYFNSASELLVVLRKDHKLIAWTWVKRGHRMPWSDEEMSFVNMVCIDQSLPNRIKIEILVDMMSLWETWSKSVRVYILCSTTMRDHQTAFLKLHAKMGYDVRGSYAYKRVSTLQAGLPIP